jgi:hypothetical protein
MRNTHHLLALDQPGILDFEKQAALMKKFAPLCYNKDGNPVVLIQFSDHVDPEIVRGYEVIRDRAMADQLPDQCIKRIPTRPQRRRGASWE